MSNSTTLKAETPSEVIITVEMVEAAYGPYLSEAADRTRRESLRAALTLGANLKPAASAPKDVVEARAQGRAEALAIILELDPEAGLDEYVESFPSGCSGDYSAEWNEEKLRELLRADDSAWSLLQATEGHYWDQLGYSEAAKERYQRAAASTAQGVDALSALARNQDGAAEQPTDTVSRWVFDALKINLDVLHALCLEFGCPRGDVVVDWLRGRLVAQAAHCAPATEYNDDLAVAERVYPPSGEDAQP
ncbi:hypothetical protein [Paraburkholderia domus]|uniref:hypothetical protein n=1 Tax=Paraburkholderia domus TaxID=2793075 RepID=UPI001913C3B3|nr:hypothetical protein [Paraburkholderia domus]MBK5061727.1 hypothetical protein [Burkholderia sp. R-70199]CAE6899360.1 hypothetical protein R70199_03600 [Paraburkholderia domus]